MLAKPINVESEVQVYSNSFVAQNSDKSDLQPSNSVAFQRGQINYLCTTLFEILNRNKIEAKYHSEEDPPMDIIIRVFENTVHDLRLK